LSIIDKDDILEVVELQFSGDAVPLAIIKLSVPVLHMTRTVPCSARRAGRASQSGGVTFVYEEQLIGTLCNVDEGALVAA
jgi:hypothetical protein